MASAGNDTPPTARLRRLVFTIPIKTDMGDAEITGILDNKGPELIRLYESILYANTKLRPWRFDGGLSVQPVLGKESKNAV